MYIGKPLQNGLSQKHKAEVMSIVSYLCKLFASYRWLVRSLGLFGPVPCSCELLFCWRLDPWFSVTLIPLLKVTPQFRNLIVFYVKRKLNHSGPYGRLEKTVTLPSVKMVSPKTPWFDGNASYYLSLVSELHTGIIIFFNKCIFNKPLHMDRYPIDALQRKQTLRQRGTDSVTKGFIEEVNLEDRDHSCQG